ncbi:MAG TPA: AAA family ATPase, partial [Leptospiraceae bacterium]|nr:AAA family ATPase [Leptospiraceae bacterium]
MREVIRDIFAEIAPWIGENKILILRGSRQVGKSTLLRHIEEGLIKRREKFFSYSIDQELDNPLFKSPSNLKNFFLDQSDNHFFYLILDEFQYLNDSGLFLKALHDSLKGKCQIIVSGSSSLEISKSTEFLTGRKIEFRIETFSFREFLKGNSEWKFDRKFSLSSFKEAEEFDSIYSQELKNQFAEYLNFGGYPEIALE